MLINLEKLKLVYSSLGQTDIQKDSQTDRRRNYKQTNREITEGESLSPYMGNIF